MQAMSGRLPVMTMIDAVGGHGGAERLALEIVVRIDQTRFRPVLCVTRDTPEAADAETRARLQDASVELVTLSRSSRFDVRPWPRLVEKLRRERFAVLHSHKIGSNIWGALISGPARVPVFVAHEHTWSFVGKPYRRLLDRELIARRADAFVAVSEADRRRMISIERIPEHKLRVIPNGITAPAPAEAAGDLRAELGLRPDQPLVGLVATLRPQKALEVLIEAAPAISARFPDARVVIAGGDPEGGEVRRGLEQLAASLGVADRVLMLGHRDDSAAVVAALDVAVLCSDYEGSPLSVLEYMEAGKPVVATRVGGVPDIVLDGETGILIEPRAPQRLADAVIELLGDPERARRLGDAGRSRRRRYFSIEHTTAEIERLYEELLARRARHDQPG